MYSEGNAENARLGHLKSYPQSQPLSDINYGAQAARSGSINRVLPPGKIEEGRTRGKDDISRPEPLYRSDFGSHPTEHRLTTRAALVPFEDRIPHAVDPHHAQRRVGGGLYNHTPRTTTTVPSLPRSEIFPSDRGTEHLERNTSGEQVSFKAGSTRFPSWSPLRDGPSWQGTASRHSTRPVDFGKTRVGEEILATDEVDDVSETVPSMNPLEGTQMNKYVRMGQGRGGRLVIDSHKSLLLPSRSDEATSDGQAKYQARVNDRRRSTDGGFRIFGNSVQGLSTGTRSGSPSSTLSSESSTVIGSSSLSSSLVLEETAENHSMVAQPTSHNYPKFDDNDYGGGGDDFRLVPPGGPTPSYPWFSTGSSTNSSNFTMIPEGRPAAEQPLRKIQALGNPRLVPFRNEHWVLRPNIREHIPVYMRSAILSRSGPIHQLWRPPLCPKGTNGRRRGIEVGDVVSVNDHGEISVLFNIFHSYEVNIASGATPPPEPYKHLETTLQSRHTTTFEIQKQKCYFSDNIQPVYSNHSPRSNERRYEFTTTPKPGYSGAIAVLPDGGVCHLLRDAVFQLPEVKQHFREHAPSWYQHARTLPIPCLENGSLLLVRKTYCARTWGIAAFASKNYVNDPITAEFRHHGHNKYLWSTQDDRLETYVGPSNPDPAPDQCIAVILSSLMLDDVTWKTYFAADSDVTTTPEQASTSSLIRKSSKSSSDASSRRHPSLSELSTGLPWSLKGLFKGKRKQDEGSSQMDSEGYNLLLLETGTSFGKDI